MTKEIILKKIERELQEEGEASIENYSKDMMQWTQVDVLEYCEKAMEELYSQRK